MKSLGFEHGKKGLSSLTDEVRSVCVNAKQSVDLELYEAGFNMGWNTYCTSFNGYEMGRKGDLYKSYCPPDKEELFREKFLIGKTVHEKKDQVMEIEENIKELIENNEKEETLNKRQDHLLLLKREIQALEQQGTSLIHTN